MEHTPGRTRKLFFFVRSNRVFERIWGGCEGERGGSAARKFGWFEKREEGMVMKNCVYFVWAKNLLWKERERKRDRSGVCKRKKSFSQWRIRQVRVPDPWWRATRACTLMDTLWRSSLCTRREPYVHHLTLAVFSLFLSFLLCYLWVLYIYLIIYHLVSWKLIWISFSRQERKVSHFYFASILLKNFFMWPCFVQRAWRDLPHKRPRRFFLEFVLLASIVVLLMDSAHVAPEELLLKILRLCDDDDDEYEYESICCCMQWNLCISCCRDFILLGKTRNASTGRCWRLTDLSHLSSICWRILWFTHNRNATSWWNV